MNRILFLASVDDINNYNLKNLYDEKEIDSNLYGLILKRILIKLTTEKSFMFVSKLGKQMVKFN